MGDESVLARYRVDDSAKSRRRGHADERSEGREGASLSERYVPMLDLVLADGRRVGLPYAMLVRAEFDPSKGITLRFSTDDVVIEGYRLKPVYKAILQHRARTIRAKGNAGEFEKDKAGSEPVITRVRCEPASGS